MYDSLTNLSPVLVTMNWLLGGKPDGKLLDQFLRNLTGSAVNVTVHFIVVAILVSAWPEAATDLQRHRESDKVVDFTTIGGILDLVTKFVVMAATVYVCASTDLNTLAEFSRPVQFIVAMAQQAGMGFFGEYLGSLLA